MHKLTALLHHDPLEKNVTSPIYLLIMGLAWSSLVEGGEGLYLPNRQTTLVIALDALSLLFCIFINTTVYHLVKYEPSPPSTKELHDYGRYWLLAVPKRNCGKSLLLRHACILATLAQYRKE